MHARTLILFLTPGNGRRITLHTPDVPWLPRPRTFHRLQARAEEIEDDLQLPPGPAAESVAAPRLDVLYRELAAVVREWGDDVMKTRVVADDLFDPTSPRSSPRR